VLGSYKKNDSCRGRCFSGKGGGHISRDDVIYDVQLRMGLNAKISFGGGKIELLKLVGEYGSIQKAADRMKMSYRHAWGRIKDMEKDTGTPLVLSKRGGMNGGRTTLTPQAEELVSIYDERMKEIDQLLRYGRKPALTVDGIVFRGDNFLAVERRNDPFKGMYALPGGFVDFGETVEEAVIREMHEETSLETKVIELVGVYSRLDRDPRGHTISCAYLLEETGGEAKAGDDAANIEWLPNKDPGKLAFDHNEILEDALGLRGRTRGK